MPTDNEPAEPLEASRAKVMARVRQVSQVYDGGVQALTDVDLELECGTITILVGANGSGKSTLLRILAAIQEPTKGTVEILGVRQPASGGRVVNSHFRSRIAFVSQHLAVDPEMTGRETLALLATLQGVPRDKRPTRITELADSFGLTALLTRLVRTYSGGQCRRLHIAAGMLSDAELFFLDEPTAGLDTEGCSLLWTELLRRARQGRTVALVTHDLLRAQEYADRVALLHTGRLVACDPPGVLIARGGKRDTILVGTREPALARVYRELTGQEVEGPREDRGNGPGGGGRETGRWKRRQG